MTELGIILDFKHRMITIDEIKLPMRDIEDLPASNKKALSFNTHLANKYEPQSTELATQRVVKILDANYEKANLPEIVRDNCPHLNPVEQGNLLGLLKEFDDLFDEQRVWFIAHLENIFTIHMGKPVECRLQVVDCLS